MNKIQINNMPDSFIDWIESLIKFGYGCEIVINDGEVNHVVVKMEDNGDWSDVKFGKVILSEGVRFKQRIFKPAIVNNKFIENIDVNERTKKI